MMHSFRMRYVVLGLLIYLQNAFCRTCGSEFDDIASKAAIAETVFEGIMDNIFIDGTVVDGAVNISSLSLYNATFEVIKTFKGDLPRHRRQYLRVTVGVFGPENPDQCNTHVDIGSQYIVFLNVSQGSVYTISHFPEPATPQAKRELRKILCDDCVVPPRARVRPTVVSVPEKGQLNLRCRAEGFPPPQIQWYKDDRPLENSQLLRIRNRKESSRLRVRRVRLEDTGLYTCVVYNALERVSQDSMVTVVSELETTTTRRPRTSATPTPADWEETTTTPLPPHNLRLCESQSYCLNGGVCYQVISPTNHWEQFCRCAHNFTGTRCQEKQQDITRHDTGPIEANRQFDRHVTLLAIVIGVIILLLILLVSYCKAKNARREYFRRQAAKRRLQLELQDGYTNEKARPQTRDTLGNQLEAGKAIDDQTGRKSGASFGYLEFPLMKKSKDVGIQTEEFLNDFFDTTNQSVRNNSSGTAGFQIKEEEEARPLLDASSTTIPLQSKSSSLSNRSHSHDPLSTAVSQSLELVIASLQCNAVGTEDNSYHGDIGRRGLQGGVNAKVEPLPPFTVVSAVIETTPELSRQHRKLSDSGMRGGCSSGSGGTGESARSSPIYSQNSRTESALQPLDAHSPELTSKYLPLDANTSAQGFQPVESIPTVGIDPDDEVNGLGSRDATDDDRASDLEVNIESECEARRLESLSSEEGVAGKGKSRVLPLRIPHRSPSLISNDSETSTTSTTSESGGEERALFFDLYDVKKKRRHVPPPLPPRSYNGLPVSRQNGPRPSPPLGNKGESTAARNKRAVPSVDATTNPYSRASAPTSPATPFNPYASDVGDGSAYFGNFGDPNSTRAKAISQPDRSQSFMSYSKPPQRHSQRSYNSGRAKNVSDGVLYDPDPDATPV